MHYTARIHRCQCEPNVGKRLPADTGRQRLEHSAPDPGGVGSLAFDSLGGSKVSLVPSTMPFLVASSHHHSGWSIERHIVPDRTAATAGCGRTFGWDLAIFALDCSSPDPAAAGPHGSERAGNQPSSGLTARVGPPHRCCGHSIAALGGLSFDSFDCRLGANAGLPIDSARERTWRNPHPRARITGSAELEVALSLGWPQCLLATVFSRLAKFAASPCSSTGRPMRRLGAAWVQTPVG